MIFHSKNSCNRWFKNGNLSDYAGEIAQTCFYAEELFESNSYILIYDAKIKKIILEQLFDSTLLNNFII